MYDILSITGKINTALFALEVFGTLNHSIAVILLDRNRKKNSNMKKIIHLNSMDSAAVQIYYTKNNMNSILAEIKLNLL